MCLRLPLTQFMMRGKRFCWSRKWRCGTHRRSDAPSTLLVPRYLWLQRHKSTPAASKETRTAAVHSSVHSLHSSLQHCTHSQLLTSTPVNLSRGSSGPSSTSWNTSLCSWSQVTVTWPPQHFPPAFPPHTVIYLPRLSSELLQMCGVIVIGFGLEIC